MYKVLSATSLAVILIGTGHSREIKGRKTWTPVSSYKVLLHLNISPKYILQTSNCQTKLLTDSRYYRTAKPFMNTCTRKIYGTAAWLAGWHCLAGMMPNKPSSGFPFRLNSIRLLQKKWTIYSDSVIKLWSCDCVWKWKINLGLHRSVCENKRITYIVLCVTIKDTS